MAAWQRGVEPEGSVGFSLDAPALCLPPSLIGSDAAARPLPLSLQGGLELAAIANHRFVDSWAALQGMLGLFCLTTDGSLAAPAGSRGGLGAARRPTWQLCAWFKSHRASKSD